MSEHPSPQSPSAQPPSPQALSAPEPPRPMLRVVRGDPSPAEVAALVTVLAARAATGRAAAAASTSTAERPQALSAWASRRAGLSREVHPGVGAWRASGLEQGTRTRAAW